MIYTIGAIPWLGIVFILLLSMLVVLYRKKGKLLLTVAFAVYLTGICYFVFFPIEVYLGPAAYKNPWYNSLNLIPLLTIDLKSFVLNMIMFLPFGLMLPMLTGREYTRNEMLKRAFALSLGIELMQMLITVILGSARLTDLNDLLANTLGGLVGWWLWKRYRKGLERVIGAML